MNWFRRKKRESGNPEIRDLDIRPSGDQRNARCAASRDLFFINDDGKRGCDGRYRALQGQKSQWLSCQLELQSFLSSWLYKEGNCEKYEPCYRKYNAQGDSKIKKEFTCQGHGKYSFRKVSKITGHEFPSDIIENIFYTLNIYHNDRGSSNGFVGNREVSHELV